VEAIMVEPGLVLDVDELEAAEKELDRIGESCTSAATNSTPSSGRRSPTPGRRWSSLPKRMARDQAFVDLSLRCCQAFMDEASDHVAVERMHERKLVLRDAALSRAQLIRNFYDGHRLRETRPKSRRQASRGDAPRQ
jgi:hypothetical protein